MDALSIFATNQALFYLSKAVSFMPYMDAEIVNDLIKTYKDKIDKHNLKSLSVINPTNRELGSVNSSLKKIVIGFFAEEPKIKPFHYSDRYDNCNCVEQNEICLECEAENKEREKNRNENKEILKPYYDFCEKLKDACDKTKLSDEVVAAKILLIRKYGNSYRYDRLGIETNECLKKMMLEEFIKQNKEFNLKNK